MKDPGQIAQVQARLDTARISAEVARDTADGEVRELASSAVELLDKALGLISDQQDEARRVQAENAAKAREEAIAEGRKAAEAEAKKAAADAEAGDGDQA